VLFIQQQLPRLFEAYRQQAQGMEVDSLVVMDEDRGFNGAVNRGPAAFVDFLKQFSRALGIDVKSFVSREQEVQG
jgi:flotillin